MNTLKWQRFFTEQKERHGKAVFSVAELANAAQTTPHAVNTELGRLMARGIITRYAQGRYGLAGAVEPEQLLLSIDPGAYITGFYALFRRHLVTQMPSEISCFTNRRHNRTSGRTASAWKLRFILVPPAIHCRPAGTVTAPVEQALCDFVYLNLRDAVDPRHLVTFMNLDRLNRRRLQKTLRRYPAEVGSVVERILSIMKYEL